MARNEPSSTACPCPKFCPLPTCPYHEDLDKLNTIEVTISNPLSHISINVALTPIVWVLGGPGCGKGTQCAKIAAKYGYTHLSTGDLLRAEVARGGEMATAIAGIMEKGALVPTEHVLSLLKDEIKAKTSGTKGFLVDGYPREKSQGMAFELAIAPATAILFFEVSEKTLLDRMHTRAKTAGRFDDKEITIQLRIKTFHENNQYVMEQYANKITKINAEGNPDTIFAEVVKFMDPIAANAAAPPAAPAAAPPAAPDAAPPAKPPADPAAAPPAAPPADPAAAPPAAPDAAPPAKPPAAPDAAPPAEPPAKPPAAPAAAPPAAPAAAPPAAPDAAPPAAPLAAPDAAPPAEPPAAPPGS